MAFPRKPLEELLDIGYQPEEENPIPEDEGLPLGVRMHRMGVLDDGSGAQHPGYDALMSHLNAMPERDSYKPNLLQSLLYGTIGLGEKDPSKGYGLAQALSDEPYERALGDWGVKEKGLEKGAQLESLTANREAMNQKRLFDILNGQERTRMYGENLGDLSRHRRTEEERQAQEAATRAAESESRGKHRTAQEEAERKRLGIAQEGLGLRKKHEETYEKNVGSQISNRGKSKGSAPKRLTEPQIHTMAVGNVLRGHPEYAGLISASGIPISDNPKNRPLLEDFNASLEREKTILRNRYLGQDLQRPVFDMPDEGGVPEPPEEEEQDY